jgi:DNA polymerase III epsilon subunit-like protein
MKYVSIDIETTGLDREGCQVLSIGAIIEDTNAPLPMKECPTFHAAIKRRNISGELYAINMNRDLIVTINQYMTAADQDERNDLVQMTGMKFLDEDQVIIEFYKWLCDWGLADFEPLRGENYQVIVQKQSKPIHITVAGKNFGTFDLEFLKRLPNWDRLIKVRQRILDPTLLYIDWKTDQSPPNLSTCKSRAGFDGFVSHNAVEDAWDVIALLRKHYLT